MSHLLSKNIRNSLLVARLPSPPNTLLKLLSLCQADDTALDKLTELIALDPGMTAKVLSVAHSAAYHRTDATPLTLFQANSRLGTALIKVLVISESVFQTFNSFNQTGNVDLRRFWKHSLSVALIAQELAKQLDYALVEEAYVAGLLHNIGRLALMTAAPEQYCSLFDALDDSTLCAQEVHHLNISHAEAGAWLLSEWHLSSQIIQSVLLHHEVASALDEAHQLTRITHLAHRLAALPLDNEQAVKSFVCEQGLSHACLITTAQNAALDVEKIARDIGIDISAAESSPYTVTPKPPGDAAQTQLMQEVLDRSVLNEMVMTLISQSSSQAALTSLRQHASALFKLEDVLVMLMRNNQQQLVPLSMNESHRGAAQLSYDVTSTSHIAECVATQKVVFAGPKSSADSALLDILAAQEMVLIPLLSSQNCLGVLVAAVPAVLSQHIKSQTAMLLAFGTYAGLALSRRRQREMSQAGQETISKQERQLGHKKLAKEFSKQANTSSSVDLCFAVNDVLQRLQDRNLISAGITIRCQLADRATLVRGSLGMIQQIVHILIKNALDSMPTKGEIVIEAGVLAHRHGAMFTTLTLSDTAAGSTQAIQAQLFEPPLITSTGDAAGLSLCDMNQLVEKMAGCLNFKASPSGTRFDILLPCPRQMQLVA